MIFKELWGRTITYAYTPAGRLRKIVYPGGKEVHYTHDGFGRLQKITDWKDNVTTFTYDGLDRTLSVALPNGSRTRYVYDARGDLIGIRHQRQDESDIAGFTMTRDARGRIAKTDRTGHSPPAAIEDAAWNFAYDSVNRLLTRTNGTETVNYQFDADGNLTGKTTDSATTTYTYDIFNRLTSVIDGADTTACTYDAAGNRLSKSHNGAETRYHRVDDFVLAFSDQNGEVSSYLIYADALIYSLDESGEIRVYHADPRGSIIAVTDEDQNIIQSYAYGPYGVVTGASGVLADNPFRFVGAWGVLADENGLSHMQAHYYDPELGRFLTEDPLGTLPGANVYAYVGGDPVNRIDPSGLWDMMDMPDYPIDTGREPAAHSEKPITTFDVDPRVSEISMRHGFSYRQKLSSYYKADPEKSAELEHIFDQYDGLKNSIQPKWYDPLWAPYGRPDCIGCTKSLLGINARSEYNANLNGLNHFELVHVGSTLRTDFLRSDAATVFTTGVLGMMLSPQAEANSYAHHATGIVDRSTGKLVAVMDPIPMSSVLGIPLPVGQGASVVGQNQTYDFEGGIMSPDDLTLSRAYGFSPHGRYGVGIVQD